MRKELSNLPFTILLADDDDDDILLTQDAMSSAGIQHDLRVVKDGKALLDYLNDLEQQQDLKVPNIILLDLNMPIMDGREVLKALKEHEKFKAIPVIILSTSQEIEDIQQGYALGASGYFSKPSSFEDLVKLMQTLNDYWYEWANLPGNLE
ncbi:response regulator [Glaciecola sp. 1036]|uniref:response regulator n=1 Tax=Alteromonadaceae TaxID=72275 RepID=UPI003D0685A1